jgi:hypothetical protein
MPILSCYVDDRTLAILQREASVSGRTVEQLAEAAIESEAIASLPGGMRGMHWPLDLGGVAIGMVEQADGSVRIVP